MTFLSSFGIDSDKLTLYLDICGHPSKFVVNSRIWKVCFELFAFGHVSNSILDYGAVTIFFS